MSKQKEWLEYLAIGLGNAEMESDDFGDGLQGTVPMDSVVQGIRSANAHPITALLGPVIARILDEDLRAGGYVREERVQVVIAGGYLQAMDEGDESRGLPEYQEGTQQREIMELVIRHMMNVVLHVGRSNSRGADS